jgi:hypothetical protein
MLWTAKVSELKCQAYYQCNRTPHSDVPVSAILALDVNTNLRDQG